MYNCFQDNDSGLNLDEVDQYEESSDDDDEGGNKIIRHVTAGRQAVLVTLHDHSKGSVQFTTLNLHNLKSQKHDLFKIYNILGLTYPKYIKLTHSGTLRMCPL